MLRPAMGIAGAGFDGAGLARPQARRPAASALANRLGDTRRGDRADMKEIGVHGVAPVAPEPRDAG